MFGAIDKCIESINDTVNFTIIGLHKRGSMNLIAPYNKDGPTNAHNTS